jgi:energy-coupling factor transporter ATP-binding protein EcfA2
MTIEADMAEWSNTRPQWQRSVLKRLCDGAPFDNAAIDTIASQLIADIVVDPIELRVEDIPRGTSTETGTRVTSLHDLTNINALSTANALTFADEGLTVIYGDNGTGKSGFARILKLASGARGDEEILGDVFRADVDIPQSAVLDFFTEDVESTTQWSFPDPPQEELRRLHFYDDKSAYSYLSENSEISYRPSVLILFDQLIIVCDELRVTLDKKLRECDDSRVPLPSVGDETEAANFLDSLSSETSPDEVDVFCAEVEGQREELVRLTGEEARLRVLNPTSERSRLRTLSTNLSKLSRHFSALEDSLNQAALDTVRQMKESTEQLRAAANIAASENFESEPVHGVGTGAWRALWEAARFFSESNAYPDHGFPHVGESSRCVLCQQELTDEGAQRLTRFQEFMTQRTETDAVASEALLGQAKARYEELSRIPSTITELLSAIQSPFLELAPSWSQWAVAASQCAGDVVQWIDDDSDTLTPFTSEPLSEAIEAMAQEILEQSESIDTSSITIELAAVVKAKGEIEGRLALIGATDTIKVEVERKKFRARIEVAKRFVDTGVITRKITELTRDYVTQPVLEHFVDECDALRVKKVTLNNQPSSKGKVRNRPGLRGSRVAAELVDVLSEGEKNALALAGLLTEIRFDESKSTVILDDPVTSLDHMRRERVARRLVETASLRPVVVFTHDLYFIDELQRHSTMNGVAFNERHVHRSGEAPGSCSNEFPWKAKDVPQRINSLGQKLAELQNERPSLDDEAYFDKCKSWAGSLSETWERAVSMDIINRAFDRGKSEVRPLQFKVLTRVTETDEAEFQAGYGWCSKFAPRHHVDVGYNEVAPEIEEMRAELERLKNWHTRVKAYQN